MKPHTRQGKNTNPFSAEVKSTETSYSNPSTIVCRPQCSLASPVISIYPHAFFPIWYEKANSLHESGNSNGQKHKL